MVLGAAAVLGAVRLGLAAAPLLGSVLVGSALPDVDALSAEQPVMAQARMRVGRILSVGIGWISPWQGTPYSTFLVLGRIAA